MRLMRLANLTIFENGAAVSSPMGISIAVIVL